MCFLNPQLIESRLFLAALPSQNWHRSSQTAVLLGEVEILARLGEAPCRGRSSKRHLLWKLGNSVSRWPLTQGFTSFCALLNSPFVTPVGPIVTVQYHCFIPAVRTTLYCFQTSAQWIVLFCWFLQICVNYKRLFYIKLMYCCNENVLFLYPYHTGHRTRATVFLSKTLNQLLIWKLPLWNRGHVPHASWYVSSILCLMFCNTELQPGTWIENNFKRALLSIETVVKVAEV